MIVGITRLRQPAVRLDGNLLAVAPFDVLDPSLHLWHEGLVDVLSRDLDGAGPIRTVPQSVGIRRWSGRADRPSAEAFGGRTGAGLVVYGSVVRRGGSSVSLDATVLDLQGRRAPQDVEVRGDTSRMGDLADSLGVEILRALGRGRPVGSVRQVSLGSRSLPSLKAFLQGEQFYRRGLWDSALAHYSRSIAEDTTNALAYRRMATVLGWNPPTSARYEDGESYGRRAIALNRGLSPRDSVLLVSDSLELASNEPDAPFAGLQKARLLEAAARRYPEDPEVWYELGEAREHYLGGLKLPGPELEAFERAIALDPGFAPAYDHTIALSVKLGRPDQAGASPKPTRRWIRRGTTQSLRASSLCCSIGNLATQRQWPVQFRRHRRGRYSGSGWSSSSTGLTLPRPPSGCCGGSSNPTRHPGPAPHRGSSIR